MIRRIAIGSVILVALTGIVIAVLAAATNRFLAFRYVSFDFSFVPFSSTLTVVLCMILLGIGAYLFWRVRGSGIR